ncbi:MAG: homocysteine S-methyltransferase family protein [Gemmataceae bacterium]
MSLVWFEGPLGTELMRRGAPADAFLPEWNVTHSEIVDAIHTEYADAGSNVFLANSFTLNPVASSRSSSMASGSSIGIAAVSLAKRHGFTLADVGPIGRDADFPDERSLLTTMDWLGDADGVLLETLSDESAFDAIRWIRRERTDWPIYVSFTFRRDAEGVLRTFRGLSSADIAERANDAGITALGVNCGLNVSIGDTVSIVRTLRERTKAPLIARPNAGTPTANDGLWVWPLDPMAFASGMRPLIEAGATMLGGCCGTGPEHLHAMIAAAEDLLLS